MIKTIAVTILSIMFSCGVYAFKAIVFDIPAAKADVQDLKSKQGDVDKKLDKLLEDTARIKGVLGVD